MSEIRNIFIKKVENKIIKKSSERRKQDILNPGINN